MLQPRAPTSGKGGQHDMRMVVALVSLTPRGVKGDVSDHPPGDELLLDEPAHQIAVLFNRQFGR